jgi:hypothetical protein
MRRRVWFAITLSLGLCLAACRDDPASPTAPSSDAPAGVLTPGRYALTVSRGATVTALPGGTTVSVLVCLTAGAGVAPASVSLDVELVTEGSGWRGSSGQLSFTLSPSGVGVAGPGAGHATTPTGLGIVLGDENGPAALTGVVNTSGQVEGTIEGHVQLSSGTSSSSCNQNSFRLTRK